MKTYLRLYPAEAKSEKNASFYDSTIPDDFELEIGDELDYYSKFWPYLSKTQKDMYSSLDLDDRKFVVKNVIEDTVGSAVMKIYVLWQVEKIS